MGRACNICGGKRNAYRVLMGNLKERDHLEGLGIDGRTVLELLLKKYNGRAWTGLIWLRTGKSDRLM